MRRTIVSTLQTIYRGWVAFVHLAYAAIVVGSLLIAGPRETSDIQVLIAYIAALVYVFVLMLVLGYILISYSRKARYAEAMPNIHSAVHEIKRALVYLRTCMDRSTAYDKDRFREMLGNALDGVVHAFNIATAVSNRACIKVLAGDSADPYVRTLARDPASHSREKENDGNEGARHKIDQNTDYLFLVRSEGRYFLGNDLPRYPNYRNTSINHHGTGWTLPYRACIVLPIRHVTQIAAARRDVKILGFLAIDANAKAVYEERYDFEMAAIVADALFTLLDLWSEFEKRQ